MKWLLAILVLTVAGCTAESDIATESEVATYLDITTEGDVTTNSIGMKLKLIPAGTFMMGDVDSVGPNEKPVHQVTLTQPFLLGVYEVTQEQYERVMGANPSEFKGSQNPVFGVSWEDAVEFCQKLSELPKEKAAGHVYRLPTEAEWEYACRAGTTTRFSFGDLRLNMGEYAWFEVMVDYKTHPVGEKKPNAWGLYDMHGNVVEWCQDWFGDYTSVAVMDPMGPLSGTLRVVRGGRDWHSGARGWSAPSRRLFGFRVACVPSGQSSE